MEYQLAYLGHSTLITTISPLTNAWNICKLSSTSLPFKTLCRLTVPILPTQIALRYVQLNIGACTHFHSPWIAFGFMGALQGVVYGHANAYYARTILKKNVKVSNMLRGSPLAAGRDIISQGIPFMCSRGIADAFGVESKVGKVGVWGVTSVVSILASHSLHNLQVLMHSNKDLGYIDVMKHIKCYPHTFWKGVEGRLVLLLLTNTLNEIFLGPIWKNEY